MLGSVTNTYVDKINSVKNSVSYTLTYSLNDFSMESW